MPVYSSAEINPELPKQLRACLRDLESYAGTLYSTLGMDAKWPADTRGASAACATGRNNALVDFIGLIQAHVGKLKRLHSDYEAARERCRNAFVHSCVAAPIQGTMSPAEGVLSDCASRLSHAATIYSDAVAEIHGIVESSVVEQKASLTSPSSSAESASEKSQNSASEMATASVDRIKKVVAKYRLASESLASSPVSRSRPLSAHLSTEPHQRKMHPRSPEGVVEQSHRAHKSGYLMIRDERKSAPAWYVAFCTTTDDHKVVRISEDGIQRTELVNLAACARRITSTSNCHHTIEVIDMCTGGSPVYLQTASQMEAESWFLSMRCWAAQHPPARLQSDNSHAQPILPHVPALCFPLADAAGTMYPAENGSPAGVLPIKGWDVVDVCMHTNNQNANTATLLLSSQSTKPPQLIRALIQSMAPICQSFDTLANPNLSPALNKDSGVQVGGTATSLSPLANSTSMMHGCLDTPALSDKTTARILKAGVLYLRMHDTGELLKPVPHALVEDSDWQPYMAILAQCGGLVSLFLYDVDESMAVEVAEIEVQQLVVGDIHADDDSLFSSSFGFHVSLRTVPGIPQESDIGASTSSDVGMFTNHRNSFLTESVYTSTHSMASGSSIKSCRRSIGSGASRSTMDQGSTDMAVAGSKLMSSSLSTHGQILPGDIVMHALEEEDDRAVEANAGTAKGVHPGKPRSKSLDSPPNLYDHSIYSDSRQAASQSILPHHALFPVNTPPVLYFAALRASDRNDWIACLRRFAQQDYSGSVPLPIASTVATELAFRVERSMWIKIFEVQGLSKVCDVTAMLIIDGLPLAQTEVQAQTNAPKWDSAAYFFSGLPQITHGAHVLVRHHEQQSGTTGGLLGYCYIPIPLLRRKHIYDGWYPLTYGELSDVDGCASMYLPLAVNVKPSSRRSCRNRLSVRSAASAASAPDSSRSNGEGSIEPRTLSRQNSRETCSNIIESVAAPSMPFRSGDVHMQVRYDELVVLTAPFYKDTTSLMFVIEPALVFDLVAVLPKSADWLVETMTKIALRKRQFVPWIEAVIKHELECQGVHDPALLFRGASVTTRAIDTFMKAVGLAYADQMIGDVVRDVASAEYKCEVDPARLQPGECAADHWQTLVLLQRLLWGSIEDSVHCCPDIMRQVFSRIRAAVALHFSKADPQVRYSCISGFIFLRLICPAMLSPKSFGIVDRQPPVPSLRALTLMAKGIQCAANLTDFAMKEPYMQPMNAFVQECTPKLKQFIDYVATAPGADPSGDSNPKPNSLFVDEAIMAIDEERETAALCAFIHSSRDVLAQAMEVHSPLPKTPRSAVPFDSSAESPTSPLSCLPPLDVGSPISSPATVLESSFALQRPLPSPKKQPHRPASEGSRVPTKRKPGHIFIHPQQRHAKNKERLADPPEVAADSDNSNITDLPQPAEGRTSEPVTSPTTDLPKLGPVQPSMPKIQNLIHLKSLIRACGAVHDCVNACMESKYAPAVSVPARRKGSD